MKRDPLKTKRRIRMEAAQKAALKAEAAVMAPPKAPKAPKKPAQG